MTCIVKAYGCSCAAGECQTPHFELLDTVRAASTVRILIFSIMTGIAVSGFTLCGFALSGDWTAQEVLR